MQASKLSESGGLSSSQPPELEESSQAKTTKRPMRVPRTHSIVDSLVENILHYLLQL